MDFDINVLQGATFKMVITIKDSEGEEIDLTGQEFRGQVRRTYSDSEVQATFEFNVLPQENDTLGMVEALLTAEQTAGIRVPKTSSSTRKIANMLYDIESELDGIVTRWLQGTCSVSPEVTR